MNPIANFAAPTLAAGFPPPRWAALCMLMLVLATQWLAGCGGGAGTASAGAATPAAVPGDGVAPAVVAFSPDDGASNVSRSAAIQVTFSEPMEETTTEAAFWTFPAVAGPVSWNAERTVLTLSPDTYLPEDTEMVVAVEDTAQDDSGLPLEAYAEAIFYIENDFVPQVISTVPEHGESFLHPALTVKVTFSEPMDPVSTIGAFSITPAAAGSFSFIDGGATLVFDPNPQLAESTTYTVTIGTGATDTTDKTLSAPFSFNFSTGVVIK